MADREEVSRRQDGSDADADRSALTPSAFAAMYEECWRPLWGLAVALLGDRALAEDVLQDAAVIGLGKLADFTPGTSFIAWMGQIVRYVALNQRRRRARRRTSAADPAMLDETRDGAAEARAGGGPGAGRGAPSAVGAVTSRGTVAEGQAAFDDAVVAALDALPETARACLLLRTVSELPYREIGRLLDIPEGTAMSHVHRARVSMRKMLGEAPEGSKAKRS